MFLGYLRRRADPAPHGVSSAHCIVLHKQLSSCITDGIVLPHGWTGVFVFKELIEVYKKKIKAVNLKLCIYVDNLCILHLHSNPVYAIIDSMNNKKLANNDMNKYEQLQKSK